ncbi:hypothetical protein LPJ59_000347 [Coemansia sp. RSA 2399]|nr:hypothetical protein LPJ59_000347 [Coemansia sp. RSA 2399]KAJ1908107.1 hypothetical protein LPJ81_000305 [Coemansia sp. IMI 209127]
MSSYTLRYFDLPGFAETSRLMLLVSKSEWTEEHPEWPQEKPNQPFGRLPVLIEECADGSPDFVLCESGAIERYLARSLGFFPSDPKKAALQEQLRDHMVDIIVAYVQTTITPSESANEKLNGLLSKFKEVLPKALKENGSSISSQSNGLTYIDFSVYSFFKSIIWNCRERESEHTDSFKGLWSPEVIKLISNVAAEPSLQSHVSDDKNILTCLQ